MKAIKERENMHVMQQVVIFFFFGSVAKPIVGSNLISSICHQISGTILVKGDFLIDRLMHRKFNTCPWTVVVHTSPCPHALKEFCSYFVTVYTKVDA